MSGSESRRELRLVDGCLLAEEELRLDGCLLAEEGRELVLEGGHEAV